VGAGSYGEAVLRAVDRLRAGLPCAEPEAAVAAAASLAEGRLTTDGLGVAEERLVSGLRAGLAEIAMTFSVETVGPELDAVRFALDSAEMVIRGTLISDQEAELPRLMPSLVFLTALPVIEHDRAIELSRRASQLIGEELRASA
jgi:hypothetical protein